MVAAVHNHRTEVGVDSMVQQELNEMLAHHVAQISDSPGSLCNGTCSPSHTLAAVLLRLATKDRNTDWLQRASQALFCPPSRRKHNGLRL